MPWFGMGGLTGNSYCTTAATTSCTNQGLYWVTNTCTPTATTTSWYTDTQTNQALYYANQQQWQQPQESEADKQRRDQRAYQKALAEHDNQEAVRLRRIISDREQVMAAQRAAEAQRQRERELEQQRRKAADDRANELLLEHLTDEQRRTFRQNKWFVIEGGQTKTKYRIRADASLVANVDVMEGERRLHRLCAHARSGTVPLGDQLLAQKIMLENDESAFLRVANRHAA